MPKDTSGLYYTLYKDKIQPCPCCGNTNLYIGHESSDTMSIVCWKHGKGCGLRMIVDMFSLRTKAKGLAAREDVAIRVAVMKWNRRNGCQ